MTEETENTETEAPPAEEPAEVPPADEPAADAELTAAEIQGWTGFRLDDMGGAAVGKVEGAYVDEQTGKPEWILARMGRFGHHALIPARDAVAAGGHVWVPFTRDQIRKAPKVDAGKPLERDGEKALLEHYGVGTGLVGRGADLAEREASAITARPA